jgi:membrane fusion protein (multidrug efflux system)
MLLKNIFHRTTLLTVVVPLLLTASCSKKEEQLSLPTVRVTSITAENIIPSVEFIGQAIAKEEVSLMARVTGFLIKRNFENGSYVKKGDIVFVIEKSQYIADVEAAKANVLSAEADYQNAIIEFNRYSKLKATNAVSQKDYDKAVQTKYSSEGSLLSAKAKLQNAELSLSYTDVIAPCDGKLGAQKYNAGNLVGPTSEPLATLMMLDPIQIQFAISESLLVSALQDKTGEESTSPADINKKLQKQKVIPRLILSNGTEYPYPGEIYFVDNKINSLTGTINIRAYFPNPNHIILPGAYAMVKVTKNTTTKSLLVPQKAVQEGQSGKFILVVVKDKKVETRNIQTTQEYGTYYIVSKGVKEGETIIVEGLQKVRSGMTVNPLTADETKELNAKQKK